MVKAIDTAWRLTEVLKEAQTLGLLERTVVRPLHLEGDSERLRLRRDPQVFDLLGSLGTGLHHEQAVTES